MSEFVASPRSALDLRRKLLNWYSDSSSTATKYVQSTLADGFASYLSNSFAPVPDAMRDEATRALLQREAAILRNGDLFLVSDEMTEVARAAAMTLPRFAIEREDFPSERGLILFDHSPCTYRTTAGEVADLVAATWWTGTWFGEYGVMFVWYEDRDGGSLVPMTAEEQQRRRAENRVLLPRLIPENYLVLKLGMEFSTRVIANSPMAFHVLAAFLLMQQPLAAKERQHASRVDARRARRAGITDSAVTVVTLRHTKTSTGAELVRPREWRHRWLVRGHWRNQWVPSRGSHRPTWIATHIKGPEDRPLKVTEKVYAWRR